MFAFSLSCALALMIGALLFVDQQAAVPQAVKPGWHVLGLMVRMIAIVVVFVLISYAVSGVHL